MTRQAFDPLSPYLERVLSEEDRILFSEAVSAARVSALRAAYIMVWIACAEALKRKFRELAPRDGVAAKVVGDTEKKEAAHNAIDKYLLDQAKDYGLITDGEFTRLEQVYEMRCVYGHLTNRSHHWRKSGRLRR